MNTTRRRLWLAVGAVALMQSAVLGSMVWDRVQLLKHGREIVLPIIPVDPRSLFRGDYVRLNYGLSRVPGRLIEGSPPRGTAVYVAIARGADDVWTPVKAARKYDAAGGPEAIVLKGRLVHGGGSDDRDAFVRYGIESYFVPEGKGLQLEALARDKKLAAVVAVDGGGHAAIKGLMIDGKLAYEEPLF
jgi:uncharacterized membrane-anchored protein